MKPSTFAEKRDPELEAKYRAAHERAKVFSASLRGPSLADQLVDLGKTDPAAFDAILVSLSTMDLARLAYAWEFLGRPKQRLPVLPKHRILAWIAARGLGKSRAAAERVRERIEAGSRAGALIGPTIEDIEKFQIGGRESDSATRSGACGIVASENRIGLLDVFPPHQRPRYLKSDGEVHFHTGAVYTLVSAKVPEWRGGNVDTVWVEEATKIPRTERAKVIANAELALRARAAIPVEMIITCTPTPDPWVRELVADPGCITILGETEENATNLADGFIEGLQQRFGKSRFGRQEISGEILADQEGALFSPVDLAGARVRGARPALKKIVVSIDSAGAAKRGSDETGIAGAGRGEDDRLYPLAYRTGKWTPTEWANIALDMMEAIGASHLVLEANRNAAANRAVLELVAAERARKRGTVAAVKIIEVNATQGKATRAEPVQVMSENGQLCFPVEPLVELEDELTTWDPRNGGYSPGGLDALVWAAFDLFDGFDGTKAAAVADTKAAFAGFEAAQAKMPAPTFAAVSKGHDGEPEYDRV
jgi:phage terminase large subunit-like protein